MSEPWEPEKTPAFERTVKKIYDADGNWIGMQITERMTKEEAEKRYPLYVIADLPVSQQ